MHIITHTDELKTLADAHGSHFFDAAALRFFSSRIHARVYGGRYFVTSEQQRGIYLSSGWVPAEPRRYTVRTWELQGEHISFNAVGEFQQYATRDEAHAAARAAARAQIELTPAQLSDAYLAAVECLIWSSSVVIDDEGTTIEASNAGLNLCDDAHRQIEREVRDFAELVRDAGVPSWGGLSASMIGHDFILTRNGHGAGFWDEGLGELGDELTHWAHSFGSVELDIYSGELHIIGEQLS